MTTAKQEVERLVNKYPWNDSKELFRAELEYLVALAQKEQMIEDHESTIDILIYKDGKLYDKSKKQKGGKYEQIKYRRKTSLLWS